MDLFPPPAVSWNEDGMDIAAEILPPRRELIPPRGRAAVAARLDQLQLHNQMQALIDALDQMDGDADLEPDADAEPLGVAQMWAGSGYRFVGSDLEVDEYE